MTSQRLVPAATPKAASQKAAKLARGGNGAGENTPGASATPATQTLLKAAPMATTEANWNFSLASIKDDYWFYNRDVTSLYKIAWAERRSRRWREMELAGFPVQRADLATNLVTNLLKGIEGPGNRNSGRSTRRARGSGAGRTGMRDNPLRWNGTNTPRRMFPPRRMRHPPLNSRALGSRPGEAGIRTRSTRRMRKVMPDPSKLTTARAP